jgi:hypothetical protein
MGFFIPWSPTFGWPVLGLGLGAEYIQLLRLLLRDARRTDQLVQNSAQVPKGEKTREFAAKKGWFQ